MAQQYPMIEQCDGGVIVTARSTVDAQQAAADALGGDCTITKVEKIHHGGIGGFFATELIKVTAMPSGRRSLVAETTVAMSSAEDLVTALRHRSPQFADRLLNELGRGVPADDLDRDVDRDVDPEADPAELDVRERVLVYAGSAPGHEVAPVRAPAPAPVPARVRSLSPCGTHFAQQALAPTSSTVVLPTVVPTAVAPSTAETTVIAPPLAFRNAARGAITDDLLDDLRDDLRDDLHNDLRDAYWPSARGPRTDPFGGELRIEREIDRDAPRPPLTAPAPVRRGPPNHAGSDHGAITGRADARWSSQSLRALGLPDRIVDAAMVQRPVSEA
ncbi:MAG TPA: hypothetical protein VGM78_07595, partial [Ilumatobacteraceae bacterium]